tara:strand:- start:18104 stop:21325 length:3222 start_codon:yes stop_codon:yes gene_type:complete
MKEIVEKLSHVDHVLKRPDSYVGSTSLVAEEYWLLNADATGFEKRLIRYSPALLKIFDEVLVNAIDRNSLYPKDVTSIKIDVDASTGAITIENNGPLGGVAVVENGKENAYNPELVFGHLLTSTNYDDTQKRIVGGRNGYGAKLANIYSQDFAIKVKDPVNKVLYTQKWTKNMSVRGEPNVKAYASATASVSVTFTPDWKRFHMDGIDAAIVDVFRKRAWDAAVCTSPQCKIKWRGEAISALNFEKFAKMHTGLEKMLTVVTDRWTVSIGPSPDSSFEQVSFVNGISTTKGGTHVDHAASVVAGGVITELSKKIQLKPQQVKNAFWIFVKATLENPAFSSQVKSECTSKVSEFGSKFEPPSKTYFKNVLKTGIQEELMLLSKIKDMKLLAKSDASNARKSKITGIPKLDDANKAGTQQSGKCTLILTEGDSAKTLAVAGLSVVGRDHYGVFPLRGKCKNVRDASVSALTANKEFADLKKILGLQQGKVYKSVDEIRYGRLMIMTDADADGSHIKGLILNMIHAFWPSLLDIGFVVSLVTPVIKASRAGKSVDFYTDTAFKSWYAQNQNQTGWRIKYYKGLGTSTSAEAREYFKAIDTLTVRFVVDERADEAIVLAFDKNKTDDRKRWLLESTGAQGLEVPYGEIQSLSISDFVHKDLVNFSLADIRRSIASVVDGFKPSQRKVMHACFQRNLTGEMKVAQLAAYVSEKTCYHHGEVSLADTIVRLANNFVGSNNVALLVACGQFGTRLMGGKDASATRYIFTKLDPIARKLFDRRDDPVLRYLEDDGTPIEPDFFVPVLPMVLINGTEGIGTGFSTFVPPYKPEDVRANVARCIRGEEMVPMIPFFNGFEGRVYSTDDGVWVTEGVYANGTITELPPGRWTQDHKEFLDGLVEKKAISGYENNSTTERVRFKITGYRGKNPIGDLKLQKQFRVSNMHLFHPTQGIKKYSSPLEIIRDFVEIRMECYQRRKAHIVAELRAKVDLNDSKARFIADVVSGRLVVFKRRRADLESDMAKSFTPMNGNFSYLLDIKTHQYTEEAIRDLMQEVDACKRELNVIMGKDERDMWLDDLRGL